MCVWSQNAALSTTVVQANISFEFLLSDADKTGTGSRPRCHVVPVTKIVTLYTYQSTNWLVDANKKSKKKVRNARQRIVPLPWREACLFSFSVLFSSKMDSWQQAPPTTSPTVVFDFGLWSLSVIVPSSGE